MVVSPDVKFIMWRPETGPESKQDVLDVYCLLRRALLDTLASCSRGMMMMRMMWW
jgi:hypothetical protein